MSGPRDSMVGPGNMGGPAQRPMGGPPPRMPLQGGPPPMMRPSSGGMGGPAPPVISAPPTTYAKNNGPPAAENPSGGGSGTDITDESFATGNILQTRELLYRLIISQLFYDGHQQVKF